jgi:hypothetical protein
MSNTYLYSISKPKNKKYGANAPQLRSIRCSIDFCVMLCNEQAKKQKIRRKRATVAPYSCRNRRRSKGEWSGAVGTLAVALGFASTLSFATMIWIKV